MWLIEVWAALVVGRVALWVLYVLLVVLTDGVGPHHGPSRVETEMIEWAHRVVRGWPPRPGDAAHAARWCARFGTWPATIRQADAARAAVYAEDRARRLLRARRAAHPRPPAVARVDVGMRRPATPRRPRFD